MLSASLLKARTFNEELAHSAAPMLGMRFHESTNFSVLELGGDRRAVQLGEGHALQYRYAAGSALMLTSHAHNRLAVGWRTRF